MNIHFKTMVSALLLGLSTTTQIKSVWVKEILNASSGPVGIKIIDIEQWSRDVVYVNPEGELVKTSGSKDVWLKSGDSAKIENTPMPWVGKNAKGEEKKIIICAVKSNADIDTCSGPGLKSRTELNDLNAHIVRTIYVSQEKEITDAKGVKTKKWVNVVYEPQEQIHKNAYQEEELAIVVRDGQNPNAPVRVDVVSPSSIPAYRETFKLQQGRHVPMPQPAPTPKPAAAPTPIEQPVKIEAPKPLPKQPAETPRITTPPAKPKAPSSGQTSGQIKVDFPGL